MKTYKIGTRGSLLAVTQSTLVKNQLEQLSGEKFELVLIKTQGDQITNKPLWQLEGKDFFTKELDEALLKDEVDLVIHSYKDLGSIRPESIKLAAVTERKYAHDVLLIPQNNINNLQDWKGEFVVGTSSPRRIANITRSLKDYLPGSPEIKCETLRGNINTRIQKLKNGDYHAITLALAGIERLASEEKAREELRVLLLGMNYFVLPQSLFPSAASQGALGIEIREGRDDNDKLFNILSQLSHSKTVEEVIRERKSFQEYGGGCHLAVGIHVKKITEGLFLHVNSGEVDGRRVEKKWIEGVSFPALPSGKKLFVGLPSGKHNHIIYDEYLKKIPEKKSLDLCGKHVFVTSRYCFESLMASTKPEGIWAAGPKSARELAARGFWVNGSADGLGTEDLISLSTSKALSLMHAHLQKNWVVLTHEKAESDLGEVVGCYQRETRETQQEFEIKLKEASAFFWTSFPQYREYLMRFPFIKNAHHFCGMGKTWQEFKKEKVNVYPVADMDQYYDLVRKDS